MVLVNAVLCLAANVYLLAGTFAYAAPELLLGEACDQSADIYRWAESNNQLFELGW